MNSYNKELEATATKKTIFIMNPSKFIFYSFFYKSQWFKLRAIKGTKDGFNLYKYAKEAILQPILPVIDQWSKSLSYIYFFS